MLEPIFVDAEFADRIFVSAGTLLKHGNCAPHLPDRLKIAQQKDGIGEIGDVDGRLHIADQSMLGNRKKSRRAQTIQILQQLMHVQDEKLLLGHGVLIAIQAVNDDRSNVFFFHA